MTTLGAIPTHRETWAVFAHPIGNTKLLRILVTSLGFSKTPREALAKIEHALVVDPVFRKTWSGWQLFATLVSDYFEVSPGGIVLHKTENDQAVMP